MTLEEDAIDPDPAELARAMCYVRDVVCPAVGSAWTADQAALLKRTQDRAYERKRQKDPERCAHRNNLRRIREQNPERRKHRRALERKRNRKRRKDPKYVALRQTYARSLFANYEKTAHQLGISAETLDKVESAQGRVCAICRKIPQKFRTDHDHETRVFRGRLCDRCNTMLGRAGDRISNIPRKLAPFLMYRLHPPAQTLRPVPPPPETEDECVKLLRKALGL